MIKFMYVNFIEGATCLLKASPTVLNHSHFVYYKGNISCKRAWCLVPQPSNVTFVPFWLLLSFALHLPDAPEGQFFKGAGCTQGA
ncbi:hypothetical protein QVD17_39382 [Tagetes erecta]|uniref:Uncharacterized protein n=1 Tax=Tagetes erecta TaxID=13708 RepID=A0AAD8JS93_TARER|nr:hypothetical protein QVD17_39382 [Tagetes erecta]